MSFGYSAFSQELRDVKKALREIQDKYDIQFIYDDALVVGLKVGAYSNWEEKLEVKLDRILKPIKLTYSKISQQHYVIKSSPPADEKQEVNASVNSSKPFLLRKSQRLRTFLATLQMKMVCQP